MLITEKISFNLQVMQLYCSMGLMQYLLANELKFTCKLWIMRGGTLLILGRGVKGEGQLSKLALPIYLRNKMKSGA